MKLPQVETILPPESCKIDLSLATMRSGCVEHCEHGPEHWSMAQDLNQCGLENDIVAEGVISEFGRPISGQG
jgi:hypothetical protein